MTEEEKKQIQIINNFIMYCRGFEERKYTDRELFLAIENISDLIQKQQAEIEKKDKMIDFMIEWIRNRGIYIVDTHEQLKRYFEKQVESEEKQC